jgi:hypothetical protein
LFAATGIEAYVKAHPEYGAGKNYEVPRLTDMDRWYEDGTMVRKYAEQAIKAGALRTIASQFVGQTLQERAGESEISDAINAGCSLRRDRIVRPGWRRQMDPANRACGRRHPDRVFLARVGPASGAGAFDRTPPGVLATGGKRVLQR